MLDVVPAELLAAKVLPYFERKDWNSFASCCKDIYEESKSVLPPWPRNCELKVGQFSDLRDQLSDLRDPTWSPCGKIVACHDCGKIYLFDQRSGRRQDTGWTAHGGSYIVSLDFSKDGTILLSAGRDGFVRLWNLSSGAYEMLQEWNVGQSLGQPNDDYNGSRVAVSPCGQRVAVLQDGLVLLKDINDGSTIQSLHVPGMIWLSNIVFSKDGKWIVFGGAEEENETSVVKVWRPSNDTLQLVVSMETGDGSVEKLALSNDGSMIASTQRFVQDVRVWTINWDTGELSPKTTLEGHEGYVSAVCFTPNDKYVVVGAGSEDGYDDAGIQFWRLRDGECTKALCTNAEVSALSYSPDGQRLLVRDQWWIFIKTIDPELEGESDADEIYEAFRNQYPFL